MAKCAPYHTETPEYPREVHHNQTNCPTGQQIKQQHRLQGNGGKPLCKQCADMP